MDAPYRFDPPVGYPWPLHWPPLAADDQHAVDAAVADTERRAASELPPKGGEVVIDPRRRPLR